MNLFASSARSLSAEMLRLKSGQRYLPSSTTIRNCDWHDHAGRNIGWGDLTFEMLSRIQHLLQDGEQFIVVSQVVSAANISASDKALSRDERVRHHIEQHWLFVVTPNSIYHATSDQRDPREIFAWHQSP
ncbi:MAG: hypothetical protein AAB733_00990 [Patescibacteria group bacterium]